MVILVHHRHRLHADKGSLFQIGKHLRKLFIFGKDLCHNTVREIGHSEHNNRFFISDFPGFKLNHLAPDDHFTNFIIDFRNRHFITFERTSVKNIRVDDFLPDICIFFFKVAGRLLFFNLRLFGLHRFFRFFIIFDNGADFPLEGFFRILGLTAFLRFLINDFDIHIITETLLENIQQLIPDFRSFCRRNKVILHRQDHTAGPGKFFPGLVKNIGLQIAGAAKFRFKAVKINRHQPLRRIHLRQLIPVRHFHTDVRIFKKLCFNLNLQLTDFFIGDQPWTGHINTDSVMRLTGRHFIYPRLFQKRRHIFIQFKNRKYLEKGRSHRLFTPMIQCIF